MQTGSFSATGVTHTITHTRAYRVKNTAFYGGPIRETQEATHAVNTTGATREGNNSKSPWGERQRGGRE
eukprot:3031107-Alexandrium_andersonii.AAC.1